MLHFHSESWLTGVLLSNLEKGPRYTNYFDRIGRKPIILLSTVGSQLALAWELAVIALQGTISVKLILTGPLFNVVGGGSTVQVASLYSIASDLVPQTDRYLFKPYSFTTNLQYLTQSQPERQRSS